MNSNIIKILVVIILVAILIYLMATQKKDLSSKQVLTDEEIYDYIVDLWAYFEDKNIEEYTEEQLVVISVTAYDGEMNNGGIGQFLTNSSNMFLPMLSNSLKQINALQHKKQLDTFINDNKVDINNIESFELENESEYDNEFYELEAEENLYELIIEYAKKNYDKIILRGRL